MLMELQREALQLTKELTVRVNALVHIAAVPNPPQPTVQPTMPTVTAANPEPTPPPAPLPAQAVVLDNQVQLVQQPRQVAQPVAQPPGPHYYLAEVLEPVGQPIQVKCSAPPAEAPA